MAETKHVVPLNVPIASRDGTLTKDSYIKNAFIEQDTEGTAVVKRAGLVRYAQFSAYFGQGMLVLGGRPWAVLNSTVRSLLDSQAVGLLGMDSGQVITSVDDQPYLTTFVKSLTNAWKLSYATNTPVVTYLDNTGYPLNTVYGCALLDGTYYVLTPDGDIRGSDLENPLSWPALNFIGVDSGLGFPMALCRHLNYVMALCRDGYQLFYNAANPTGSPLLPVSNASFRIGCAAAHSVLEIGDELFFMTRVEERDRQIVKMSGMQPQIISTPYINRILNRCNLENRYNVRAFCSSHSGHTFYVLQLIDIAITLAFDTQTNHWAVWASGLPNTTPAFKPCSSCSAGNTDYYLDYSSGVAYTMSETAHTDDGSAIEVFIRTPPVSFSTSRMKYLPALYLFSDTIAGSVNIRWSDDDYQSFTTWRVVDLMSPSKMLARCGASRRRSWDIQYTANTSFRVYGLETEVTIGSD